MPLVDPVYVVFKSTSEGAPKGQSEFFVVEAERKTAKTNIWTVIRSASTAQELDSFFGPIFSRTIGSIVEKDKVTTKKQLQMMERTPAQAKSVSKSL